MGGPLASSGPKVLIKKAKKTEGVEAPVAGKPQGKALFGVNQDMKMTNMET